jgi:DNA-binding NarL/FixJ family response regulator
MRGNGQTTAVVLDRHPLWLDALEDLLNQIGITVLATATSVLRALELVAEKRPTLFVGEYEAMAQAADGPRTLERLTARHPNLRTVVIGTAEDMKAIEAVLAAGAAAYCVKTAERRDLAAAIRQAFHHSFYLGNVPRTTRSQSISDPADAAGKARLTCRETEILKLVAEGHPNAQLAKMLWVTEQTVKFHLSNVYRKLDVANRTEAARWAQLNGLLATEQRAVTAA